MKKTSKQMTVKSLSKKTATKNAAKAKTKVRVRSRVKAGEGNVIDVSGSMGWDAQ